MSKFLTNLSEVTKIMAELKLGLYLGQRLDELKYELYSIISCLYNDR